jgi:hypothetical protein
VSVRCIGTETRGDAEFFTNKLPLIFFTYNYRLLILSVLPAVSLEVY